MYEYASFGSRTLFLYGNSGSDHRKRKQLPIMGREAYILGMESMINTLVKRVFELADITPDKMAVAFKKERLTYRELAIKALGISEFLKAEGILPGDRVCYSALSKPEMVAVYLGISLSGAVSVFLDKNSTLENMILVYEEAGAKLMLTNKKLKDEQACRVKSLSELYQNADAYAEAVLSGEEEKDLARIFTRELDGIGYEIPAEDSLSEILFTSGTTGRPKGVMLSYKSVYNILKNTIEGIHIDDQVILLLPLPLNHSFALRVLRAVLYAGGSLVLQNGFTFAKEVENNIEAYHCNGMACVPTSYEVMKSQMQDKLVPVLSKLSFMEFGAGSLTVRQRREIMEQMPDLQVYNTWGSSESGGAIFCNVSEVVKDPVRISSLGRPLAGKVELKIMDAEGKSIPSDADHPGRMAIKGDMQMMGYWNNPEGTAKTLVDGWLVTGDMAYMDEEGNVYMLGRADDIINVGGEKVSPIEVENIACQYEYVKECACIGVADPEGITGQIPVLFLVSKSGYAEEELHKFIASKAERYKLPQRYVLLEELPRNRMQKIDRRQLKKIWENQGKTDLMNPVVDAILSRHSIRKFTDAEIPEEILAMILKCGYHAPSGHNMQTWKFTVLTKKEDLNELKSAAERAARENKVNIYGWENPKVIILISNDNRNQNGCQDASCAAENMLLASHSYGLGAVWLNPLRGLRDAEPVKSLLDRFGIPANHTVWSAIALGYPAGEGASPKKKDSVITFI